MSEIYNAYNHLLDLAEQGSPYEEELYQIPGGYTEPPIEGRECVYGKLFLFSRLFQGEITSVIGDATLRLYSIHQPNSQNTLLVSTYFGWTSRLGPHTSHSTYTIDSEMTLAADQGMSPNPARYRATHEQEFLGSDARLEYVAEGLQSKANWPRSRRAMVQHIADLYSAKSVEPDLLVMLSHVHGLGPVKFEHLPVLSKWVRENPDEQLFG